MSRATHTRRLSVVVVDPIPEMYETIRRWLQSTEDLQVIGHAATAREGIDLIRHRTPDVILISDDLPGMRGLQMTKLLCAEMPTRIILLSNDDSKEQFVQIFQAAIHAGARDCLHKPPAPADLIDAIYRVAQLPGDRQAPPPGGGRAPGSWSVPITPISSHFVVAVCGTKGGVGRSMLAANLAATFLPQLGGNHAVQRSEEHPARIALVDANIEGGDQQILFNIEDPKGLEALCGSDLDYNLIASNAVTVQPQLDVFCAPQQIEHAGLFTADSMRAILVELREQYDVIIVDVAASLNPATVATLESADRLIFVTTLELSAIHRLQHLQATLRNDIPRERWWMVANRIDGAFGIKAQHVEKSLGMRFASFLPEDAKTVNNSVNLGLPFVINQRRTPLARAIIDLGQRLRQDLAQEAQSRIAPPPRSAFVQVR